MKSSVEQILVPTNFSGQSSIALEQACNVARLMKSEITIMHVIEQDLLSPFAKLVSSKEKRDKLQKAVQAKLDAEAKKVSKESGVKVNTLVTRGKVYEQVTKTAAKIKAGFIVMGLNDSGVMDKFIGSNTIRVIRTAPCAVITIRGTVHRQGCKNILLPLDFTKQTRQKVAKAIELAETYGSAIRIVSVQRSNDEFMVNKLNRQMEQVQQYIEEKGIKATAETLDGDNIARAIINYGKKIKADLLVIMTQQEKDFTEFFIGSTAQQIINHSDIPVLSIRPSKVEYTKIRSKTSLY